MIYQVTLAVIFALTLAQCSPIESSPLLASEEPQLLVITEDVIPDDMNTTQKVIRVNPVDRPALNDDQRNSMESALYKIQSLLPAHRTYTSSKRIRKPKTTVAPVTAVTESGQSTSDLLHISKVQPEKSVIDKYDPKRKHLHFLYNQSAHDGGVLGKRMKVRVAPGAYPVYYMIAKTNGSMGKWPLKHFQSENEFVKYLTKNKLASN